MTRVPEPQRILLEGNAEERGATYGAAARDKIALGLDQYRTLFERRGVDWDDALDAAAALEAPLREAAPEEMTELAAIARGADRQNAEILLLNGRSEVLNTIGRQKDMSTADMDDGCTALVVMPEVSATGDLIHAQNWDWRPECENTTVVLTIRRDDGPDILTYVEAGGLARCGFNGAGIAITGNNLQAGDETLRAPGIPLSIIRRLALKSDNLADAMQAVASSGRTVSNNMIVSCATGGGEAFNLEAIPDEIFWIAPEDGLLVHANHFVSEAARARVRDTGLLAGIDSIFRDRRVRRRLEEAGDRVTRTDIEAALGDRFSEPRAVLRSPRPGGGNQISATVATILMEPARGTMHVRQSPYRPGSFTTYNL